LKLAQLHLNDGVWSRRRVYSQDWSRRATSPYTYQAPDSPLYGYLWWIMDYPHADRTVRAYSASGNGGQASMAIPELGLAIVFLGGNYNDIGGWKAREVYVPEYILPAISE
jgi:CubicO group peptidase (beta-lactamase class C family)